MPPIQFYFELASPYSYLASLQIEQLGASANRSVREDKPIFKHLEKSFSMKLRRGNEI